MSEFQHKENRGSLFRNERKEQETHPDHKGEINVDGTMYWLSAWIQETKDGKKYFSLSVKPKGERHKQGMAQAKAMFDTPPVDEFQDDIPF